jgi:hypothetical protein
MRPWVTQPLADAPTLDEPALLAAINVPIAPRPALTVLPRSITIGAGEAAGTTGSLAAATPASKGAGGRASGPVPVPGSVLSPTPVRKPSASAGEAAAVPGSSVLTTLRSGERPAPVDAPGGVVTTAAAARAAGSRVVTVSKPAPAAAAAAVSEGGATPTASAATAASKARDETGAAPAADTPRGDGAALMHGLLPPASPATAQGYAAYLERHPHPQAVGGALMASPLADDRAMPAATASAVAGDAGTALAGAVEDTNGDVRMADADQAAAAASPSSHSGEGAEAAAESPSAGSVSGSSDSNAESHTGLTSSASASSSVAPEAEEEEADEARLNARAGRAAHAAAATA